MATASGAAIGAPPAGVGSGVGAVAAIGGEITGTARIKWGALVGLLGLALSIVGIVVALTALPLGGVTTTPSGSQAVMTQILAGVLAVGAGVFLALLSFVLYVAGFASLRKADGRFRTPMVLGLVGPVGLLLIGTFMIFYAASIESALGCSASDVTCQNNATTLARGIVVLGYVGGLLGLVGLIGAILGLYRFGTRYSSPLTKVGGILYIVPFVAVVAPLLVFVGAYQVHKKLRQSTVGSSMAPQTAPMSPPSV